MNCESKRKILQKNFYFLNIDFFENNNHYYYCLNGFVLSTKIRNEKSFNFQVFQI